MRIISGKYKGKKLIIPNKNITRPTTDRLKETLFNILKHRYKINFETSVVLDCFSGSGSLGLECISRGCERAWFIDNNKEALSVIKKNITLIKAEPFSKVILEDITKLTFTNIEKKFDLIFLDPPYSSNLIDATLINILKQNILSNSCYFIIESNIVNYNFDFIKLIDTLKVGNNIHYICTTL